MTNKLIWDDCPDAITRRGWLFVRVEQQARGMNWPNVYREQLKAWTEPSSVGNYLDYGDDHYRSPHAYCDQGRGLASCQCHCRLSQPGNIHCVIYSIKGSYGAATRYVETVEQAKQWIEEQARLIRPELFQEQAA